MVKRSRTFPVGIWNCLAFAAALYLPGCALPNPLLSSPEVLNLGPVAEGRDAVGKVRLSNLTNRNIAVEAVSTSCGCTAASTVTEVPARGYSDISVSYHSAGRPGPIDSTVLVVTKEQPSAPLSIAVRGTVVPVLTVNPPIVRLGTMRSGELKSFTVNIKGYKGRRIVPVSLSAPQGAHGSYKSTPDGIDVSGRIIAPPVAGTQQLHVRLKTTDALMPVVDIPVEIEVPNECTLSPSEFNFGLVPDSLPVTRSLQVGKGASDLRVVQAPSGVKVTLKKTADTYQVSAVITTQRESLLSDKVVLATGNARQPLLVVPIYAAFASKTKVP